MEEGCEAGAGVVCGVEEPGAFFSGEVAAAGGFKEES